MVSSKNNEFEIKKTEEEWRKTLTPEQFNVLRKHGTERAYTSPLDKQYGKGTYVCGGCELPLFSSDTKFNSGTGWPSFFNPIEGAIDTSVDRSFFMTRI
ncbi:MAG TPA: peptide-methionine (R)-S-oxide reductase, partial [Cyanobacteria bacterium UBA11370]|nr:peptide-methionine (R)-S-oxide reductase [Cyanobacteria bacterium UBA11370]